MSEKRVEPLAYEAAVDRTARRRGRPRPSGRRAVVRVARVAVPAAALAGEWYLGRHASFDGSVLACAMLVTAALLLGTVARLVADLLIGR